MEISVIASGSNGNCCLVEDHGASVLIDAGKSGSEIETRMGRLGKSLEDVDGIVITHQHSDHISGAGVDRRTCYDILQRLLEKGLVSFVIVKGVKQFSATDPKNLLKDLDETRKELNENMPTLEAMKHAHTEGTEVEVLRGHAGIKAIFNEILGTKKDYYGVGAMQKLDVIAPIEVTAFLRDFKKGRRKEYIIMDSKKPISTIPNGEYRYLSKKYVQPATVLIYQNTVAIFILKKPFTIIRMRDSDIAATYKKFFDAFWELAESYPQVTKK